MKCQRVLTLLTGMVECMCFAGITFGWASLVFVLKKEQYFQDLCPMPLNESVNTTYSCPQQDEQFSLVFTVASFMNNGMMLPGGYIFDRFGTAVTRFIAIVLHTGATLLIGFSNSDTAVFLFPALTLLAVGGILLMLTNMQVGNLFGLQRSTIITLYNGAFDSSSVIFLIVKVLYQGGVSLRITFLIISSCCVCHILRTVFLMPKKHIPYPLPEGYCYGNPDSFCRWAQYTPITPRAWMQEALEYENFKKEKNQKSKKEKYLHRLKLLEPEAHWFQNNLQCRKDDDKTHKPPEMSTKLSDGENGYSSQAQVEENSIITFLNSKNQSGEQEASFKSCVMSSLFVCHFIWMSIMQLRHYMFIGTLNPTLTHLSGGDPETVSYFTNVFAISQFCGVLCAPWNGLIMDRHKKKNKDSDTLADMRSAVLSLALTVVQCTLFSICAALSILPALYPTFILQVLNRSFLYGGNAAFLSIAFPLKHFGKLYGLVMFFSAVVSLLQYPAFYIIRTYLGGDPFYVNIFLLILGLLAFLHPINVFRIVRNNQLAKEHTKK